MAFTVEDGSGVAGANSLCSVEDADDYWTDRGNSAWSALSTTAKQAALIQASEFLSQSVPWIGTRADVDADMAWPREVYAEHLVYIPESLQMDYSGVPVRVVQATARVAAAVAGGVELFGTVKASAGATRYKAGSVEIQYLDEAARIGLKGRPDFPWLLSFLAGYVDRDSPAASKANRKVQRV